MPNKPQMIIFDYGHTLVYEDYFDLEKGGNAFYEHIADKSKVDRTSFVAHTVELYRAYSRSRRELYLELPCDCFTKYLREYYDIEFDVDETELQEGYWDATSPPNPMPGADELLSFLTQSGIRTAVLSNLWYNEDVLSRRINRLLPHADFEFYISTHTYGFRKPHKQIFELALKKAKLSPSDVWFCGDEPLADIHGAHEAGLTPIWFVAQMDCPYKFSGEANPTDSHIFIQSLKEIEDMING